ncbi:MAG: Fe-S cluster assembly ATPase SufC [Spirochaetales bacterium]|nr:Fe-S cluster assembly ATPase SufC [Spirochaetales bacterium]
MAHALTIHNLKAQIQDKPILNGINLEINSGEIHALMGPNGSGKSTLANVLMGSPEYTVTGGQITLDVQNLLEMQIHERAQAGIFLAFQYPVEIPGVTVGKFLKRALETKISGMNVSDYLKDLRTTMDFLEMDQDFINRYVNDGFSGGEKKRMEILQMLMLKPRFAILDETDSGLDIDALKIVARGVNRARGSGFGALIITHYQRLLDHIRPDFVHIMYNGKIITSGGEELVRQLEEKGYDWIKKEYNLIEEEAHEYSTN